MSFCLFFFAVGLFFVLSIVDDMEVEKSAMTTSDKPLDGALNASWVLIHE